MYYNRFRYYAPEEGVYISQDPIGLAGGMELYRYVKDVNSEVDVLGLSGVPHSTLAWNARTWQGSGDYPSIDSWRTVTLKKGTVVYGGVPGQSEFYISKESFESIDGNKESLWESLQVKPHDKFGYRLQMQGYILTEDVKVGKSIVSANAKYGKGGATQYFIENYSKVMKPDGNRVDLKSKKLKVCG